MAMVTALSVNGGQGSRVRNFGESATTVRVRSCGPSPQLRSESATAIRIRNCDPRARIRNCTATAVREHHLLLSLALWLLLGTVALLRHPAPKHHLGHSCHPFVGIHTLALDLSPIHVVGPMPNNLAFGPWPPLGHETTQTRNCGYPFFAERCLIMRKVLRRRRCELVAPPQEQCVHREPFRIRNCRCVPLPCL